MTFAVPLSLLDMRAALRERTQLDVNDPRAADAVLNRLINAAMHRFQIADPNGWPWDFAEVSYTCVPAVEAMLLNTTGLVKVRYVILRHPSGIWEYPLERVTRYDQLCRYPRDGETGPPRTYCLIADDGVGGVAPTIEMHLRPKPDVAYTVLLGAQSPRDDLVASADPAATVNAYMISEWSDTVLDYAAFLVYRARDDFAESSLGAKAAFDAAVLRLRRTARVTVGAGIPGRPVADDRNLQ